MYVNAARTLPGGVIGTGPPRRMMPAQTQADHRPSLIQPGPLTLTRRSLVSGPRPQRGGTIAVPGAYQVMVIPRLRRDTPLPDAAFHQRPTSPAPQRTRQSAAMASSASPDSRVMQRIHGI